MLNGIYANASAMDVATKQHDVIANNLANANHPGFRRTLLAVSTRGINQALPSGAVNSDLRGNQSVRTYVDFSQGGLDRTERKLDVAINGDGFFKVETPNGIRYTRNGSFHLSSDRQLVTSEGAPVLGGGPIQIPADVALSEIVINSDGTIRASDTEIGKLDVVSFDDLNALTQTGPTQFSAPDTSAASPSDAMIMQGTLESSNASVVHEMISMIIGMRHFEAAQQSLRSISDVIQQFTTFE